jgi:hypothetical protein
MPRLKDLLLWEKLNNYHWIIWLETQRENAPERSHTFSHPIQKINLIMRELVLKIHN